MSSLVLSCRRINLKNPTKALVFLSVRLFSLYQAYEWIDEPMTHGAGERDGGSMALKGFFKKVSRVVIAETSASKREKGLDGRKRWNSPARLISGCQTAMLCLTCNSELHNHHRPKLRPDTENVVNEPVELKVQAILCM